jgi:transposase InsO family protein
MNHREPQGRDCEEVHGSNHLTSVRTSIRSPWQNGTAERWVGSCRRDLLDHVIAFHERHLKRLLAEYVRYYHDDRTHLGLQKETPGKRMTAVRKGDCTHVFAAELAHVSTLLRFA